jgi:hypothetical protein
MTHETPVLATRPATATAFAGAGDIVQELLRLMAPGGIFTLYAVKSAIDDNVYGPFVTYDEALAFAESAGASVYECTARLVNVREV